MKIQPYINNYKNICCSSTVNPVQSTGSDVVSFGYMDKPVDKNMQIYRSISESEFRVLLHTGKVYSNGYVTSDERGWGAKDWNSGYIHNKAEPVYFVTFKKGALKILDRRDSEDDSRYGICGAYTLNDVASIRRGFNAHGELVFAPNFDSAKKEDIAFKLYDIENLLLTLESSKDKNERINAWDELSSYANEFPSLVEVMHGYVDFEDKNEVLGFVTLIVNADKQEHRPFFDNCLKAYLEGVQPATAAVSYLKKYATQNDLDVLFKLLNNNVFNGMCIGDILSKIIKDTDLPNLYNYFDKCDWNHLVALTSFVLFSDNAQDNINLVRDVLYNVRLNKIDKDRPLYGFVISTCANLLGELGKTSDIDLLSAFYDKNNPYNYPSYEVGEAINNLKNRDSIA